MPRKSRQHLIEARTKARPRIRVSKTTAVLWIVVILVPLVVGLWVGMLVSQRVLRSRAESMLADLQSIHVGTSTREEAQAVISKWYGWGTPDTTCNKQECVTYLRLTHNLPEFLTGYTNPEGKNWLARIVDHLGGRNAVVAAGFKYKGDMVTGKGFTEQVTLPVRDWYVRGGSYVPDLPVSVEEDFDFTPPEQASVQPGDPFKSVRRMKGPYGLLINFTPQESDAEKQKLMAFRFDCITQFSPCHDESDILPAAAQLSR